MVRTLNPGTLIGGRFVIEEVAGSGGMGTVYRGHEVQSDAPVALKVLHAEVGASAEAERFDREVQILAELRHPGIVSYVAHGVTDGGQPYLVMEWLAGEDLSQRLRRGRLGAAEALKLLERVATALDE